MAKQSQVEKAIEALESERDVLNLAIAKLQAQQAAKPKATRTSRRKSQVSGPDNGE